MNFAAKFLLLISDSGLGRVRRVFHDHRVELTRPYAIPEAVFSPEGSDLYLNGNPLVSLDVSEGGATLAADQAVWTDAMAALLSDAAEQKQLGQLARERMQDFTRERIFGQWVKLLDEVQLG